MSIVRSTRREFLRDSMVWGAGLATAGPLGQVLAAAGKPGSRMKFGLVTYLWGQNWDLPTVIANCEKSGVLGVELRTEHAHKVEANLTGAQRQEVKRRFADSKVTLVSLGTNFAFHYPDEDRVKKEIEGAKQYIKLAYDCGASGMKVKPNDLPKGVPYAKTIEQIGRSLNELGQFAAGYGQEVRLEVHGGCSLLPTMKAIMDFVTQPNVGVCWNCNNQDLEGEGLESNFKLVRSRFSHIAHVRELNLTDYPYQQLINLMVASDYDGWVLLEGRVIPKEPIKALTEQRELFARMVAQAQSGGAAPAAGGVKLTQGDGKVTVEINGKLFTEYCTKDVIRPYFYPVIGPTGEPVIRHWPLQDGPANEDHDHPHHKSLWFTHGAINGVDFWSDGKGKIVHDKFLEVSSGPKAGVIKAQNKYVAPDGKVVCTDTRTHRFQNDPGGTLMDWEITLHASNGPVTFGDTKEGSMAIRLTPTMQPVPSRAMKAKGEAAQGHIVNSEGLTDGQTWGKRATWVDYYGPVKGEIVGVAIFDHPSNPRHPTWWHVRDYGLFAVNPFGIHDFEKKPAGAGDLVIPAGQSVTFKYRFYFHKGDEKQGQVAEHFRDYAKAN
ncbi:MAG: PmoA family protein [Planctomycetes bacterium]|nr:PmoA family protein [Planctomycetota bacterium]